MCDVIAKELGRHGAPRFVARRWIRKDRQLAEFDKGATAMDEYPAVDDFSDDNFLFEEEDDDPVATAVCQALYPVLSGVFARELALTIGR